MKLAADRRIASRIGYIVDRTASKKTHGSHDLAAMSEFKTSLTPNQTDFFIQWDDAENGIDYEWYKIYYRLGLCAGLFRSLTGLDLLPDSGDAAHEMAKRSERCQHDNELAELYRTGLTATLDDAQTENLSSVDDMNLERGAVMRRLLFRAGRLDGTQVARIASK